MYKQCGSENTLVGVIGVDYSLSAVQVVLSKARTDGSYAFIINQFGEVSTDEFVSNSIVYIA